MAGKINFSHLSAAIQEVVKQKQFTVHEQLIMGFVAPDSIPQNQAEIIAREITDKVAPGAQPFAGEVAGQAGAIHAEATKPIRILGFRPSPKMLE